MKEKLKIVLTGATGMAGEGVLRQCLVHDQVEQILVVGRRNCGISHPKIQEIILTDFMNPEILEEKIKDFDACFFCLGVSSVGMKEAQYTTLTHTLTLRFARTLSKNNPQMTFCYISGAATDSTEKGRIMWARVKGRTENNLKKLPFKAVYNFRPGYMQPDKGSRNTLVYYKFVRWMYPLFKLLFPGFVSRLSDLGRAMIQVCIHGYTKTEIEVKDIKLLSSNLKSE